MAKPQENSADFVEGQMQSLLGLCYAMTGNEHEAWDLVQEAFARLGSRWGPP